MATSFVQDFRSEYTSNIQLSHFQAQAVGMAVCSCGKDCRLLVFGVGNDTGLWLRLNKSGLTHFLETEEDWISRARSLYPGIRVSPFDSFGLTVRTSMLLTEGQLTTIVPPPALTNVDWDVVLVDAPMGFSEDKPGRAVSIYWSALLAKPHTHVFVHDYERPLEKKFADLHLRKRNASTVVIPANDSDSERQLLWSMGNPLAND